MFAVNYGDASAGFFFNIPILVAERAASREETTNKVSQLARRFRRCSPTEADPVR